MPFQIHIANLHNGMEHTIPKGVPPGLWFRVDRQSNLGNPFRLLSERWRHDVCSAYRTWLRLPTGVTMQVAIPGVYQTTWKMTMEKRIAMDKELTYLFEHARNADIVLLCWCAPKECHAEAIRDRLDGLLGRS